MAGRNSQGGETSLDGYLVREELLELSAEDRTLLTLQSMSASCDELAQRRAITPTAGVTIGPGRIRQ